MPALTPGVGKTTGGSWCPTRRTSIHCPSGEIATQELFRASPELRVWTYSDQVPSGACTRYIFERAGVGLVGLDVVAVVGGVGVATWFQPRLETPMGMVPMPV